MVNIFYEGKNLDNVNIKRKTKNIDSSTVIVAIQLYTNLNFKV